MEKMAVLKRYLKQINCFLKSCLKTWNRNWEISSVHLLFAEASSEMVSWKDGCQEAILKQGNREKRLTYTKLQKNYRTKKNNKWVLWSIKSIFYIFWFKLSSVHMKEVRRHVQLSMSTVIGKTQWRYCYALRLHFSRGVRDLFKIYLIINIGKTSINHAVPSGNGQISSCFIFHHNYDSKQPINVGNRYLHKYNGTL